MNEQEIMELIEKIKQNERKNERIIWMNRIVKNYLQEEQERKRKENQNLACLGVLSFLLGGVLYVVFK